MGGTFGWDFKISALHVHYKPCIFSSNITSQHSCYLFFLSQHLMLFASPGHWYLKNQINSTWKAMCCNLHFASQWDGWVLSIFSPCTGRISENNENEEAEQDDIWVYVTDCSLVSSLLQEEGYDNMQQVSGRGCYMRGVLGVGGWHSGRKGGQTGEMNCMESSVDWERICYRSYKSSWWAQCWTGAALGQKSLHCLLSSWSCETGERRNTI